MHSAPLGPYRRTMPPDGGSRGGGLFLMSDVPLSTLNPTPDISNPTGVPRSSVTARLYDPTVGPCTGPAGVSDERGIPVNPKAYTLNPQPCRGTSRISNSAPIGPYSTTMHRALWWS